MPSQLCFANAGQANAEAHAQQAVLAGGAGQVQMRGGMVQADGAVGAAEANVQVRALRMDAQIGFRSSQGIFINYTDRLDPKDQVRLVELLGELTENRPDGYRLNLDTLIDSKNRVLGGSNAKLNDILTELRQLAEKAAGTNLHFTDYPVGHRTCVGKTPTFSTEHSERSRKLQLDKLYIEQRLDELRSDHKSIAEQRNLLARYLAAKGLMEDSNNLLQEMMSHGKFPHLERDSRKQGIAAAQQNKPHEAAVLLALALSGETPAEVEKRMQILMNGADLPTADRKSGWWQSRSGISEQAEQTQKRIAMETGLLQYETRADYERERHAFPSAEERSDDATLFFYRSADAIAMKNEEEVWRATGGYELGIAVGHLHVKDLPVYRATMGEAALRRHRALQKVKVVDVEPALAEKEQGAVYILTSQLTVDAFEKKYNEVCDAMPKPLPAPPSP